MILDISFLGTCEKLLIVLPDEIDLGEMDPNENSISEEDSAPIDPPIPDGEEAVISPSPDGAVSVRNPSTGESGSGGSGGSSGGGNYIVDDNGITPIDYIDHVAINVTFRYSPFQ